MTEPAARAIAVVSVHASPLSDLGRGENGGMNLGVLRLCEGLAERGVPTDVFVRRDDPDLPAERQIAPGSRLILLDVGPPQPVPKDAVIQMLDGFADAVLERAAREERIYRLVHAHYWLSGLVARRLRDGLGTPWVQSFHSLARMRAAAGLPFDFQRGAIEEELVGQADRIVAMSRAEGRALLRLYRARSERICVAEPGVDLESARPAAIAAVRRKLGLQGRRMILFAGRLEPLKGAETLVEAIRQVASDPDLADTVCVLIGDDSGDGARSGDGGERRRLEGLVASAGISDRVRFLGAIPHTALAPYYALADVCVVPSRVETFGLVALEAQAQGTPVVAARVGGLPEVVADGETGHLIDGHDPSDYAAAIAALLHDDDARRRMGDAARRRAATFGWDRMVDRILSIYNRVSSPEIPLELPCGYEVSLGSLG